MQQISISSAGGSAALAEAILHADHTHWAKTHGVGDRKTVWAIGGDLGRIIHRTGCLAILLSFPFIAVFMWHVNEHCNGSASYFLQNMFSHGDRHGLSYLASAYPRPSLLGLRYILSFGIIQATLQLFMPGRRFIGPATPKGNHPAYTANGVKSYLATLALFFSSWYSGIFNPADVYDAMGTIISTSNIFSLALCALLYLKGRFAPSSTDSGTTGSLLWDYYWGTELYPRLFSGKFDIKTWTNCRMGMGGWAVLTLCYLAKQAQLSPSGMPSPSMLVTVGLMQLYIFKFFLWETGYWCSMDIAHDRAGFYLVWGCLVWVPGVYTSPSMYLVRNPGVLNIPAAIVVFLVGAVAIYVNYDSDRQRHEFRQRGGCKIWGKAPIKIEATFVTADGQLKKSLLLASGWWGLARHFHYLPELIAAAAWSCPAGTASMVPYLYFIFLALLLVDRSYRDDERCKAKYGKAWKQYCQLVPYRIIPGVF